ncbi:MAG: glutaredoxin family protein [Candidatus Saccharimonas sp.]|nr:glutaredoxin family protein [Planctomycetaceae bacterium]
MTHRHSGPRPNAMERLSLPGTIALAAGVIVLVLQGIESAHGIPGMPRFWHQNQPLWFLLGMVGVVVGWQWLWQSEPRDDDARSWKPAVPGRRFRRLTLYTRANCSLCDEAAEVLTDYSNWLPPVDEVDIDSDPHLAQQFNTCVPVVACDGKVRFRGRIDETLLRRLIEGTPPIAWP